MSEDFIEYEEENEGGSNNTFLTLAGLLTLSLISMLACSGIFLAMGPGAQRAEQIAAIETQNAMVAVTNEAVTRVIALTETAAAMPTETAVPTETSTPTPTSTATSTATVVVQSIVKTSEANETITAEETADDPDATSEILGTSVFDAANEGTPTPIAAAAVGDSGGTSKNPEALPQTGLGTFTAVAIAFLLILTFFGARRLRNS